MLCYGPLVSELGAQSAWCPNPVIGGAVPPAPGSAAYGKGKQLRTPAIYSIGLLKLSVLSFRKGLQLICYIRYFV